MRLGERKTHAILSRIPVQSPSWLTHLLSRVYIEINRTWCIIYCTWMSLEHGGGKKVLERRHLKNLSHFKIEYAKRPFLLDFLNVKSWWKFIQISCSLLELLLPMFRKRKAKKNIIDGIIECDVTINTCEGLETLLQRQ